MNQFDQALEFVAESVAHMNVSRYQRELIKAGLRCAIEYAKMKRAGYELSDAATQRQTETAYD